MYIYVLLYTYSFPSMVYQMQAFICRTDKQDPTVQQRELYSIKFVPYCCSY